MKTLAVIAILIAAINAYFTIYGGQSPGVTASTSEQEALQCNIDLYNKAVAGDKAALFELRLNAEKGVAAAQNNLAVMYAQGQGLPQDKAEAVKWYRKSADQGTDVAQDALGVMYGNGEGVPRDNSEARKWFQLAANQGNESAKQHLMQATSTH